MGDLVAKKFDDFGTLYEYVKKNARRSAITATKNVTRRIKDDMYKQALRNLEIYYSNYDPDVYDRTYNLKNAIRSHYKDDSHYKDNSSESKISIEVGIIYDEANLANYASNSWYHQSGDKWVSRDSDSFDWDGQANGTPSPEWILDNFLHGIHPRTTKGYSYAPITDPKSQIQLMEEFINNEIPKKVDAYMNQELIREFTRRMA